MDDPSDKGGAMSFAMIDAVKWLKVSPTQKLLLLCLADFHNGKTGRCDPSYASIMALTGLSNRAVADAIIALRDASILGPGGAKGSRTSYTFTIPTSERGSQEVVNEVHSLNGSERGSLVNEVHNSCEPASQPPVNVAPKVVSEVHTNRNKPELKPEGTVKPEGAGEPPPVVKVKSAKPDWRDWNRGNAEKANAVELPADSIEDFRTAWKRWCEYRTAKAVDARISSMAIEWTVTAAESGIRDCQRAAKVHGWPAVIARIDQAMQGWRGFNFDRLTPPRAAGYNGQPKPKHAAYDAETATLGLTADQIGKF